MGVVRVLIADNNIELCRILEEFLNRQQDMDVIGLAYNGEQALEKIQEFLPDVVILDLTMPQLDGIGVMERLQTMDLEHRPKIIILTAFAKDDMVRLLTHMGADYFVVKPFDLEVLVDRIRQFAPNSDLTMKEERSAYYATQGSQPEILITELLHHMGVPPHFKGYTYLREAVLMVCRNRRLMGGGLSKELYPRLAEKYDTTVGGVEAAIRNAINSAWRKGNKEFVEGLTGSLSWPEAEERLPTNSLVIAKLADRISLEMRAG
jgi:two-component system response regulator (stage 0 sporulation protein A)